MNAAESVGDPETRSELDVVCCGEGDAFVLGTWSTGLPAQLSTTVLKRSLDHQSSINHRLIITSSTPCSQPSFEGLCHHCARLVHILPLRTRKPRHHLPNSMRANEPFTISCRNTFNPPSSSYRTFLVRATPTSYPLPYRSENGFLGGNIDIKK